MLAGNIAARQEALGVSTDHGTALFLSHLLEGVPIDEVYGVYAASESAISWVDRKSQPEQVAWLGPVG